MVVSLVQTDVKLFDKSSQFRNISWNCMIILPEKFLNLTLFNVKLGLLYNQTGNPVWVAEELGK